LLFRAWDKLYVVLHGSELYFFKDIKHRQENATFHNEPPIQLSGCVVQPSEYSKRKNVISLKLPFGSEYLFQTSDEVRTFGQFILINASLYRKIWLVGFINCK
jgi:hypothetical protein